MALMVDQILAAAYRESNVASLDSLKKVIEIKDGFQNLSREKQNEVFDVLGLAHLALLKLDGAAGYFLQSGNDVYLQNVFELALRHGKYFLVKLLIDCGMKIGDKEYLRFLKEKAIPYVSMYRDPKEGFSIDEKTLYAIIADIGETPEKTLSEAVEFMEKSGSMNVVKKFILAHYAKNPLLVQRYEKEFNEKAFGGRANISAVSAKYCQDNSLGFVRSLQASDQDNYFPSVAHIFLVKQSSKKLVFKENLRLHQDYSRLGGYSMEKEILEIVQHENIVKYLGSIKMDNIEFLVLDFMPGMTLERCVRPDNLLPTGKVIEIIITLAEVIDYLHQNRIISMDVKDKNVMYDGSKAILFDFGVSQIATKPYITSLLTTPEYTAPEMALTFKAYPQTDVFQLGVLFYKLLVGKNPFVRYDLCDFAESEDYRESAIIKFVLPALLRDFDRSPKILQENPRIADLLSNMLQKNYEKRPEPKEIAEKLRRL